MREIDFLAWDNERKVWLDDSCLAMQLDGKSYYWTHFSETTSAEQDIVILEFTGFRDNTKFEMLTQKAKEIWLKDNKEKDWKGIKIYEKDILKSRNGVYVGKVEMINGLWTFTDEEDSYPLEDAVEYGHIKIGNYLQSPELLETLDLGR